MLTEKARPLLSKLIDANWEVAQHELNNQQEPDYFVRYEQLCGEYHKAKQDLIDEIGVEEYNRLMRMGSEMFS